MSLAWRPFEASIVSFLEDRAEEALEFARALIRTPSPNPPGNERAVVDLLANRLRDLGVTDIREHGASPDRPNLIARVAGTVAGRTLVLSGHTDTKPAGDLSEWRSDPWDPVLEDGELHGLGSGDMKVALAAMVYAAGALVQSDFPGEVLLVLTADEEAGSALGSKWLVDHDLIYGDAAIIGEPGGVHHEWESIHLVSRGVALFRIKIRGTQMHSSITDRLSSVNASMQMAKLMVEMDRDLLGRLRFTPHPLCPTGPTLNVGVMVEGGVYFGVCPGYAEFSCDIRTLPGMTEEALKEDIEGFLMDAARKDPDLQADLEWVTMMPACEIRQDESVVSAVRSATRDVLGFEPRLDAFPGATDAAYLQLGAGIPTVAAVGPGLLPRAHSPNESLAAEGVRLASQVFALAASRYLHSDTQRSARQETR